MAATTGTQTQGLLLSVQTLYQLSYSGLSEHIHQFTLTQHMWSYMPSFPDPYCLYIFPSCQSYFQGGHLVYSQKPSDLFPEVTRKGWLVYIIQAEPCRFASMKSWLPSLGLEPSSSAFLSDTLPNEL